MKRTIDQMFRRYGTQMMVCTSGDEESVQGFLHFNTSRSLQNTQRDMTVLGEDPGGQYVLILPAGIQILSGDTVETNNSRYVLVRVEQVVYRDEILCQWCLCVKRGG